MSTTMYGIPNCDTIKKARKWLEQQTIEYQFHDYRKDGVSAGLVSQLCQELGWENVVNKRGTTYRQLTPEQQEQLNNRSVIELLCQYPAMIKRPILNVNGTFYLGFKIDQYSTIFDK
jgi:Spx/MgsR family transcriptional regulator